MTKQTLHKKGKLNGYLKRCSILLVIREVHIKTTMINHLIRKNKCVPSSISKERKASAPLSTVEGEFTLIKPFRKQAGLAGRHTPTRQHQCQAAPVRAPRGAREALHSSAM